jgi:hypothetical protein
MDTTVNITITNRIIRNITDITTKIAIARLVTDTVTAIITCQQLKLETFGFQSVMVTEIGNLK